MIEKIKTGVKEHFKDIATLKKSSHSIAFGFALGTFIAVLPTFGFGILIGLFLVLLFKKISKLALFASFIIWNPFVLLSIYPINYILGNVILSNSPQNNYGLGFLSEFLVGSFVSAVFFAIVSYLFIFLLVENYKRRKASKMENKV